MNHSFVKHLILLPTRHLLHKLRKQFLDQRQGLIDVKLSTFDDVAHTILHEMDRPVIALDSYGRKKIIQHLLLQNMNQEELSPFREAMDSQGLLSALIHQIGEIKRAGFSPDQWAAKVKRMPSDKSNAVAFLYKAYQETLYAHESYILTDPEETLILARQHYIKHPHLFKQLQSITVDHFTDFTPLQMRLLNALIERVPFAEIRFPFHPERFAHLPHLYQVNSHILDNLLKRGMEPQTVFTDYGKGLVMRKWMQNFSEIAVASSIAGPTATDELQRFQALLLQPTREKIPAFQFVELMPSCDAKREVESVAKEIKRLILMDGVHPSDIAIIIRDAATYEFHVEDILRREGIPSVKEQTVALHEVPLIRHIMALCRLPQQNWHRHTMLAIAEGAYINWQTPPIEGLYSWIIKSALVQEKTTWFRRAERERKWLTDRMDSNHKSHLSSTDEELMDEEEIRQQQKSFEKQIKRMDQLTQWLFNIERIVLPLSTTKKDTILGWIDSLESLLAGLGVNKQLHSLRKSEGYTQLMYHRDLQAWEKLHAILSHMRRMASFLPSNRKINGSDFLQDLESLLREEQVRLSPGVSDGVFVLDPSGARGDRFDTVFVLGMNEGKFPSFHREQWLMNDTERLIYGEEGTSLLPASHFHNEMEQMFFWMTAALPRKRLILSFTSPDVDEKVLVSSFLEWIIEHVEAGEWLAPPRFAHALKTIFVPEKPEEVTHPLESVRWHLLYGGGNPTAMSNDSSLWEYILDSVHVEFERYGGPFGKWDGHLENPIIHEMLAQMFSSKRKYSVSLINEYATCPYRFFLSRVLRLQPLEEHEEVLTPIEKGNLLHEVLRRLLSVHRGEILGPKHHYQLTVEMGQLFEEECAKVEQWALFRDHPLWPLEKEKLWSGLCHWLEYELIHEKSSLMVPAHLEFSFGLPLDDRTDEHSQEDPVVIELNGERIPFYGRIDRIDLAEDGSFVIYDYKLNLSRYRGYADVKKGQHFQLPIYIKAFASWLKQNHQIPPRSVGAGFYSLDPKDKVKKKGMWLKDRVIEVGLSTRNGGVLDSLEEAVDDALKNVSELLTSIRKGKFHLLPHHSIDTYFADPSVYRRDSVRLEQRCRIHKT
jgi:ATP-dependent helicase/nuclease subunit B